jgi:hypothetical protein
MMPELDYVTPKVGDKYYIEYWAGSPNLPWVQGKGKLWVWYSIEAINNIDVCPDYKSGTEVKVKDVSPITVLGCLVQNGVMHIDCRGDDGSVFFIRVNEPSMKKVHIQKRLECTRLVGSCRIRLIDLSTFKDNHVLECLELWGNNCSNAWKFSEEVNYESEISVC